MKRSTIGTLGCVGVLAGAVSCAGVGAIVTADVTSDVVDRLFPKTKTAIQNVMPDLDRGREDVAGTTEQTSAENIAKKADTEAPISNPEEAPATTPSVSDVYHANLSGAVAAARFALLQATVNHEAGSTQTTLPDGRVVGVSISSEASRVEVAVDGQRYDFFFAMDEKGFSSTFVIRSSGETYEMAVDGPMQPLNPNFSRQALFAYPEELTLADAMQKAIQ